MRRKSAIISLLIAFVMLFTVFAVNVPEAEAAVNKNTYWIKVNTQCNVVTVYKKSGSTYKPIRAMACSTGKKGHETPQGTFRMGTKIGWCKLVGNVWGQYSIVIKGNYLFHSVPFKKKSRSSMQYKEYNKLGTNCSHGCVRLSTMDAKWIWDNCPKKTRITIYKSANPGPLGKPESIKMKSNWKWDPTDPKKGNPNFCMKLPEITIANVKAKNVEQNSYFPLKSGVTAKNINANQNLTSKIKIGSIYRYNATKNTYVKVKKFSQKTLNTGTIGKYRIRYTVYDYYSGGTGYKYYYVNVVKPEVLSISAENRDVLIDGTDNVNAVLGVTALQNSLDRTNTMVISIIKPGEKKPISLSYSDAEKFVFDQVGDYIVTYSAKNGIYPYDPVSKTIKIRCKKPEPLVDETTIIEIAE